MKREEVASGEWPAREGNTKKGLRIGRAGGKCDKMAAKGGKRLVARDAVEQ